jgi:hypothetical protein
MILLMWRAAATYPRRLAYLGARSGSGPIATR